MQPPCPHLLFFQQLSDPLRSAGRTKGDPKKFSTKKKKKISKTRLALTTAAGRGSRPKTIRNICTCLGKRGQTCGDPAWNFLFLSQRSNAPQIRFDSGAALGGGGKSVNRAEPSLTCRPLSAAPANISSIAGRAAEPSGPEYGKITESAGQTPPPPPLVRPRGGRSPN